MPTDETKPQAVPPEPTMTIDEARRLIEDLHLQIVAANEQLLDALNQNRQLRMALLRKK